MNTAVDAALLVAAVVAVLALRMRARHRKYQLDRAYARALSDVTRRARWSALKALLAAALVIVVLLLLETHA